MSRQRGSISHVQRAPNPVQPDDGLALHKLGEQGFSPVALGSALELLQADLECLAPHLDDGVSPLDAMVSDLGSTISILPSFASRGFLARKRSILSRKA